MFITVVVITTTANKTYRLLMSFAHYVLLKVDISSYVLLKVDIS